MTDAAPPVSRTAVWWIVGLFFFAAFLVYGASLTHAFVRWDDGLLIYENPAIRAITPSTVRTIFTSYDPELYIPLTFLSYQIDYLIGGTHPAVYHFQNLLWHTLNALLVALLLRRWVKSGWVALLGGLLFAVHPLHTEAVAWASARKDVLSTFFFFGSLLLYLRYRDSGGRSSYAASLAAFTLGSLAKVTVITLPLVLLLFDFLDHRRFTVKVFVEKIPYVALSALFAVIAAAGKTGVLASSTLNEKILMAPLSILFYVEKFFLPLRLTVLYPFVGPVTIGRLDIAVPLVLLVLLLLAAAISLRWTRTVFFAAAFFLVTVAPSLLNFAKGDFFYFASDRYAYIPSVALLFLVALAADALCRTRPKTCLLSGSLLLLTFGALATLQARTWKDSTALFTRALAVSPEAFAAQVNLGNVHRYAGDEERAMAEYESALTTLRHYGRGPGVARSESKILSNLASAKREQGDFAGAQAVYNEALAKNPQNIYAMVGLGVIAGQKGQTEDAEQQYRRAILSAPDFAPAQLNLGALLVGMGRLEEGIDAYRAALQLNPFFPQAHYNLGVALAKLHRTDEAAEAYSAAIELQPKFTAARVNLGILFFNDLHDADGAQEQFEAILRYDPDNAQARAALQQIRAQR